MAIEPTKFERKVYLSKMNGIFSPILHWREGIDMFQNSNFNLPYACTCTLETARTSDEWSTCTMELSVSHVYLWHRYLFISDSNFPINVIVFFLVQIEQGYQTIFFFLCILVVPENYSYLSHRRDFFPLEIPISCKV